jgi:hypothetical protein
LDWRREKTAFARRTSWAGYMMKEGKTRFRPEELLDFIGVDLVTY